MKTRAKKLLERAMREAADAADEKAWAADDPTVRACTMADFW